MNRTVLEGILVNDIKISNLYKHKKLIPVVHFYLNVQEKNKFDQDNLLFINAYDNLALKCKDFKKGDTLYVEAKIERRVIDDEKDKAIFKSSSILTIEATKIIKQDHA